MNILPLAICVPMFAMADMPLPSVDLRVSGQPPLLTTWAHAGGKAMIQVEAADALVPRCAIYQLDGRGAAPISRDVVLDALKQGANRLEIPLPGETKRGKLLLKLSDSRDAKPIANLIVDILPEDSLESLIRQSKQGRVWIDPALKPLRAWASFHGIASTPPTPEKPVEFHFGKPIGDPSHAPAGRVLIFERDQPDAFPVIEVITSLEVTKILVPPGFLEMLPTSATAEALLLRHMHLLP